MAALLAAVLAADAAALLLQDRATPYGADQAVAEFRRQAAASTAPSTSPSPRLSAQPTPVGSASVGPGSPSPTATGAAPVAAAHPASTAAASPGSSTPGHVTEGVYRYATSGHEQVDALGGARHDYPAESAVTYQRGGCGDEDRWQPLKERYSSNTVCRGPHGLEARVSVQRRQFFGQSEEQDLVCAPGLLLVPDQPRPGQVSSGSCRSDDTVVRLSITVRDVSPTTVGGRRVQAVHVTVDARLTGSTRGTTHREEWFTPEGLLVRGTSTTETDRDTSAGVVHYSEVYDLRLDSLDPER